MKASRLESAGLGSKPTWDNEGIFVSTRVSRSIPLYNATDDNEGVVLL